MCDLKIYNNISQDDMRNANYRGGLISPMIYPAEVWVQVSSILPFVNDYYYISTYGRVYSAKSKCYLTTDLNQTKYKSIVFTCKDRELSKRICLQELFQKAFGNG